MKPRVPKSLQIRTEIVPKMLLLGQQAFGMIQNRL
jgi:hypothetical protein